MLGEHGGRVRNDDCDSPVDPDVRDSHTRACRHSVARLPATPLTKPEREDTAAEVEPVAEVRRLATSGGH